MLDRDSLCGKDSIYAVAAIVLLMIEHAFIFSFSLARAVIRRSKILVMDEATSSVDQKTDLLVQKTIQREFVSRGVSVITVAHRLDTILGYDKIIVFGSGQVLEYDTPAKLLARPNGELRLLYNSYRNNLRRSFSSKEGGVLKQM